MEDDSPHRRAHDRHDEERQQQQHPEVAEEPDRLSKEEREPETGEELRDDRADGEQRRDHYRAAELRVGRELDVIAKPDEPDVPRPEQPPVVETYPGGIEERYEVDREQEGEAREQEPAPCPGPDRKSVVEGRG